ncbi:MAG: oligogalacturonate lyase family protein [Halanaerobiales bacterium]
MINLSDTFKKFKTAETEREVVQLTEGEAFCYPLYYFIPSITKDEKYLIYHRAEKGEVQLYRLNLETGENTGITSANCKYTHWQPWCTDQGEGVLDHRSVLNVARNEVIYFSGKKGNEVHCINVESLKDEIIFTLPEDRIAIGQNCVTPDGKWFIYIHHDRELFNQYVASNFDRSISRGTELCAYNLETGEKRTLIVINSPIHHVIPYDNRHVIFCHPATENGMLLTDINGGWYKHLRTQDIYGGTVCHYLTTSRGIAYEVLGSSKGVLAGMYNPFTDERYEFKLPDEFGYTHTGADPEGKIWFFDNKSEEIYYLKRHNKNGEDSWQKLFHSWETYGGGQKAHYHPRITEDRKWMLLTAGDEATETNHLFLLNIEDLSPTQGM